MRPPGEEVTVYPVIALPPLLAGAPKVTVASPNSCPTVEVGGALAAALTAVGALGSPAGVTSPVRAGRLGPVVLNATTSKA